MSWDMWRDYILATDGLIESVIILDIPTLQIVSQGGIGPHINATQMLQECADIVQIMGRISVRQSGSISSVRTHTQDNVEKIRLCGVDYNILQSDGQFDGAEVVTEHRNIILKRCGGAGFCVCYQSRRTTILACSSIAADHSVSLNIPSISPLSPLTGLSSKLAVEVLQKAAETLVAGSL